MYLNEIEEKVLQSMDLQEGIRLLQELVRIQSPNPPGDTSSVADFLINDLAKRGFKADSFQMEPSQVLVEGTPRAGITGQIAFFYPESTEGLLVELNQS